MESNRIIIDTDSLIDLLRGRKETVEFVTELEKRHALLCTTSINAFELYYGAHKSKQSVQALQATRNLLDRLVIFPFTPRSAERAGHIYADLELQGAPIGLRDTFIAAIALSRGCKVATKNIKHFGKVKELAVFTV
jgi:tRNA(fMet)-specific endonuclease VapC